MNLTLHQFRKEARFLLPRWLPWLVLLALDLAVNVEWIAPLNGPTPSWLEWFSEIIWYITFWLAYSHAPEDSPANLNRFGNTRPLPLSSYWLARITVFITLIVLPLMLHEGLYLWISQRPATEIFTGMAWRAFLVIAYMGWIVLISGLFRGTKLALALLLMAGIFYAGMPLMVAILRKWMPLTEMTLHTSTQLMLLGLFSLFIVFFTWLHIRQQWSLARRLTYCSILVAALLFPPIFRPGNPEVFSPENQKKADEAAVQLKINVPSHEMVLSRFMGREGAELSIYLTPKVSQPPTTLSFEPRPLKLEAMQEGKTFSTQTDLKRVPQSGFFEPTYGNGRTLAAISPFLPQDTLFTSGTDKDAAFDTGRLVEPFPALDRPTELTGEYALDWIDWSIPVNVPLQAGAKAETPDSRWEILAVRLNENALGAAQPGAVAVDFRMEYQSKNDIQRVMLQAPDRRIAWIQPHFKSPPKQREIHSTWQRMVTSYSWSDVLTYPDGEPAKIDPTKLRFTTIKGRYLGTTRWTWKSGSFKLKDYLHPSFPMNGWSLGRPSLLYQGQNEKVFEERLKTIATIHAKSSTQEVNRYLYEILLAANVTDAWKHSAAAERLKIALQPVIHNHLEVLLDLPNSAISDDKLPKLLAPLLSEKEKPNVIAGIIKRPWLADIVKKRGWDADAMPLLENLPISPLNLDYRLMKLMQSAKDPGVQKRLIEEVRRRPRGYYSLQSVINFSRIPELRPQLKSVADEVWRDVQPILSEDQSNTILIAVSQGNKDALDLSIRLAANLKIKRNNSVDGIEIQLAPLVGFEPLKEGENSDRLTEAFRELSSADFHYLPELARWEKIHP